jgi:lipoic acid synthetase
VKVNPQQTMVAPKNPIQIVESTRRRLPEWFKVPAPGSSDGYRKLKALLTDAGLNTVCEEARCPNIGDCWSRGTSTFMILGDTCTRACRYCAVKTGDPGGSVDTWEPLRVARAVTQMKLEHAVITSVDRDDLPDGGADIFAKTIRAIHRAAAGTRVEVLIPDFGGNWDALQAVLDASPEILNHNIESVPRTFRTVRPRGSYWLSLELLERAKRRDANTKSGLMVGLGETIDEILSTMDDLRDVGCDILTIGQYLRPSERHEPLARYYTPLEFAELKREGMARGFRHVESGPLVRSSYHAEEQSRTLVASP